MSLKCSLNSRFSAFTENNYLKNIATSARTYSFWVYIPNPTSGSWNKGYLGWFENNWPFVPAGASAQTSFFFQKVDGNAIYCRSFAADGGVNFSGSDGSTTGGWKHIIIAVTDATHVNVYLNNVQIVTNGTVGTTHFFTIGHPVKHVSGKTDSSRYKGAADCLLADLCVFDGVISSGERATLYAAGAPTYARTSTNPITTTMLLRCPLEDHYKDVVSDTYIFGSQFHPVFVPESPFSNPSTTNIIPVTENAGVCSQHLIGQKPDGLILSLGDSFGTIGAGKINSHFLNKLTYSKPFESLLQMQLAPGSTTGNTGTVTSIATANNYRHETQTTRTVTASSHSAGTLTLTYNGPNLVVGQTIRLGTNGSYLIVSTFTAGTGTGTSQTGAIVTCALASNPGSLVGDTIQSICAHPSTVTEWYDNNGTSTGIMQWTIGRGYSAVYAASNLPSNGPLLRLVDWYDNRNLKIRIWHRCASDPAIQVKAVKFQYTKSDGTISTGETVSGLDAAGNSGKICVLGEFSVPEVGEISGGEGSYNQMSFRLTPTGTAADSQNRYLEICGVELVFTRSEQAVRMISTSEASWGFSGFGATYPAVKAMDALTMQSYASCISQTHPNRQVIITFDCDLESLTASQYLTIYTNLKASWDAAFDAVGARRPKYLIWGYIFQEIIGGTLAANRGLVIEQNLGALSFAKANPRDVEFISLYQLSKGIFSPMFEQAVLPCAPNHLVNGEVHYFEDLRITPTPNGYADATWNNGTLTLTRSNAFRDHVFNAADNWYKTYVYLEPTVNTGTPVIAGWYQVASITNSTVVLTATCTGGAAGVGADVKVVAFWTPMFTALHLNSGGASCLGEWIIGALASSVRAGTSGLRIVGDRD